MKKYIGLVILSFFFSISDVVAYEDNCSLLAGVGSSTCITICGYDYTSSDYTLGLLYYPDDDTIKVVATVDNAGYGLSLSDDKVFVDSTLSSKILESGYCPSYAVIDDNFFDEFCLANSESWCTTQNNSGTEFDNVGTLSVTFADTVTDFFNNFEITESDLLSDSYDLEEELISSFEQTILYGLDMPSFILNMDAYQDGLATLQTKIDTLKSTLITNVENDESLTEEEKAATIDTINTKAEEKIEALESAEISLIILATGDSSLAYDCSSYLGYVDDPDAPAYYLNFAFNLIKYIAIVGLFVFTIIEYAKAIPSGKDDAVQRATQNTIKRIIIAVIIFFLPILINFLFDLLDIVSTDPTCGIGL